MSFESASSDLPSLIRYSDQVQYFEHDRKEMLPFVPETAKRVLEIGCGSGAFGKQVKSRQGVEYWGVELIKEAAGTAASRLDRVFVGTVEQNYADLPRDYFDLLVCNDILEHMVDPYHTLALLKSCLKSDGKILCSIPNFLFIKNLFHVLIRKDWQYEDWGIRDRTHLRFFTKKSARRMLEELGFRIEICEGILPTQHPLVFSVFDLLTLGHFHEAKFTNFAMLARKNR